MTILAVFAAAFDATLAGAHLGWRFHRAFLRWRRDAFCEHCGRITLRGPSIHEPIDPRETPPMEDA